MSIPPQLIRVKRKRVDESPVTFLQLDEGAKRHRSDSHWVYQRRQSTVRSAADTARQDNRPVIHVSGPADAASPTRSPDKSQNGSSVNASHPPLTGTQDTQHLAPRKFHVSRAMLAQAATTNAANTGGPKRTRHGPTVFVERSRKKLTPRPSRQNLTPQLESGAGDGVAGNNSIGHTTSEGKQLKKPGVSKRQRDPSQDSLVRAPLPASLANRDNRNEEQIAADMNDWVLNEIGVNLQSLELEKTKQTESLKFRPKAPEKRIQERHPQLATQPPPPSSDNQPKDTAMADVSDEEGDGEDWIIEEYVRVPANYMAVDISPAEVGILVLNGEEENMLFFGTDQDDDDDFNEDDEDENAENYYTADYPEDEVDSDDEFNRHAYLFRQGNASDDEEFDHDLDTENDEMVLDGGDGDDDAARMARIREFMKRNSLFG